MPVTRDPNSFNDLVEWTDAIQEVPNQSGFIKAMNFFTPSYTEQSSILFDKSETEVTLLAAINRKGGKPTFGKDRKSSTFSLPLAYFMHNDTITKDDYVGKRKAGTADMQDTFENVVAEKLEDLRRPVDQTHEYMMLSAIKGVCVTPDGTVLADMFNLFGITQTEIDFELGTPTTNIDAKISELKDAVVRNIKTGGIITTPLDVIVDRSWFDAFVSHPNVSQAYLNSQSNVRYQNDMSDYFSWGISDVFVHRGVRFMVYSHVFTLPDSTTEEAVELNTGHVIPRVQGQSVFRSVYGGSTRLDSQGGAEMFSWSYRSQDQRMHELEVETSCLMYATKPAALVKVITSN